MMSYEGRRGGGRGGGGLIVVEKRDGAIVVVGGERHTRSLNTPDHLVLDVAVLSDVKNLHLTVSCERHRRSPPPPLPPTLPTHTHLPFPCNFDKSVSLLSSLVMFFVVVVGVFFFFFKSI